MIFFFWRNGSSLTTFFYCSHFPRQIDILKTSLDKWKINVLCLMLSLTIVTISLWWWWWRSGIIPRFMLGQWDSVQQRKTLVLPSWWPGPVWSQGAVRLPRWDNGNYRILTNQSRQQTQTPSHRSTQSNHFLKRNRISEGRWVVPATVMCVVNFFFCYHHLPSYDKVMKCISQFNICPVPPCLLKVF